jgi:GTP-binding protein
MAGSINMANKPKSDLRIGIVGRPNVGKSTLFNRLVGKKLAIVDDTPGVTRDRRYGNASLAGIGFMVIDTAGMDEGDGARSLTTRMLSQTREAIAEADGLFFVIDARTGITPLDETYAKEVRRTGKPVIVIANKAEGNIAHEIGPEIHRLGFSHAAAISAEHGEGLADLFDAMRDAFGSDTLEKHVLEQKSRSSRRAAAMHEQHDYEIDLSDDEAAEEDEMLMPALPEGPIQMAVLGRPNAGKSTLINALIGEDRQLTGPESGITRDTITLPFSWKGQAFSLQDTAGMRKRNKITDKLEKLAVADGLRAMRYAQIVVLLLDAHNPLEKQDISIAALTIREGRALIIAINKWDLVSADKKAYLDTLRRMLDSQLAQASGVPIIPVSALKEQGLDDLMQTVTTAHEVWNKRVPTAALNRWLEHIIAHHSPPLVRGRRLKIKYISQIKMRPPTFTLHCNVKQDFPESYLRYLTGALRRDFGMVGTPIRLIVKASENPYAHKTNKPRKRS